MGITFSFTHNVAVHGPNGNASLLAGRLQALVSVPVRSPGGIFCNNGVETGNKGW